MRNPLISLLLAASFSVALAATSPDVHKQVINLPQRRTVRIPSPNGRWLLIASPFSISGGETLTLENKRTRQRTVIKHYDRDIDVGWSPDSTAFFLNDAEGSNVEDAYIYRPNSNTPLLLDDILLKNDVWASEIVADHTYFQVRRWLDPRTVVVEFCEHNSDATGYGGFDLMYRVQFDEHGQNVIVRPLSPHTGPFHYSGKECAR